MRVPKYTPEESARRLDAALAGAQDRLEPVLRRYNAVELDEAIDMAIGDERLILYTSALFGLLSSKGLINPRDRRLNFAMLHTTVMLGLLKQDILTDLGVEE